MMGERRLETVHRFGQRRADFGTCESEGVVGNQQPRGHEGGCGRQQYLADPPQGLRFAREPSDGVEARGKIDDAVDRDEAVRGADAENPAIARRQTNRAAAIGAEREIHQAAGNRDRRSARRPAGNPARRARIGRRAVVHVLAVEAVGHLVGVGLADHAGASGQQALDCRGSPRCGRMGFEPDRVAVAGAMAGDVEHVLDREGQAAQRAFGRAGKLDVGVAAKGVVVDRSTVIADGAGSRVAATRSCGRA